MILFVFLSMCLFFLWFKIKDEGEEEGEDGDEDRNEECYFFGRLYLFLFI